MSEPSKADQLIDADSAQPDAARELARKHGISSDRAQMLIDRMGKDSGGLEKAAAGLRINPKIGGAND